MDKLTEGQIALNTGCHLLEIAHVPTLISITKGNIFTISFVNAQKFANLMIKLEDEISKVLGYRINLEMESLGDRNKRIQRTNRG